MAAEPRICVQKAQGQASWLFRPTSSFKAQVRDRDVSSNTERSECILVMMRVKRGMARMRVCADMQLP